MQSQREIVLTPVQLTAANCLLEGLAVSGVLVLRGQPGSGKTTILQTVHAAAGGAFLGARQFVESRMARQRAAIGETFLRMIEEALVNHDLVFIDDLHLVTNIVESRGHSRSLLLNAALTVILGEAGAMRKKLVFGVEGDPPWAIQRRAYCWDIGPTRAC
jgi:Holliday junction resolvasome RuvABC ATP-dependent DNA helicase subunit